MAKAPVYREQGHNPAAAHIKQLREVADVLDGQCPKELHDMLLTAITDIEESCRATLKIRRGSTSVGYGLDKAEKAIDCDRAIAIIKQIKAIKAW